jgi:hypothetical protein
MDPVLVDAILVDVVLVVEAVDEAAGLAEKLARSWGLGD